MFNVDHLRIKLPKKSFPSLNPKHNILKTGLNPSFGSGTEEVNSSTKIGFISIH